MSTSSTCEPEATFVCDCEDWMRSACARESFYKEHEGKRYCVLHFPSNQKGIDFKEALQRKLGHEDFNFQGVCFPDEVSFLNFDFNTQADFRRAIFNAQVDFGRATFKAGANFKNATFIGKANFRKASFDKGAKTDFSFGTFNALADFSFVTLNAAVYFSFAIFNAQVDFRTAAFMAEADFRTTTFGAWAYSFRDLAINSEENHRYEQASRFRYWAMDTLRRERWRGFPFLTLAWWYWLASGYGERVGQAFIVLFGIWLLFGTLYTKVGLVRWEPRIASESDLTAVKRDDVGAPLKFSRALTYSAGVMTLQKPEPRPATTAAQTVVLLETILGPVQAALLALAIRRKFMR